VTTTEHPAYGTCTGCTQGKGVTKDGFIKPHNRTVAFGNGVTTVECAGSRWRYAEFNRTTWHPQQSRWVDMPLQVAITEHDETGEHAASVEIHSFSDAKKGHAVFVDKGMSLHMLLLSEGEHGRSTWRGQLRDSDGAVRWESDPVDNDGGVNGLVLRWMERLAKDTADAKGGQS